MATPAVVAQAPQTTTAPMTSSFTARSPSKPHDTSQYAPSVSHNMSFTSQSAQGPSQYPSALTQSMTSQNGSMAHSAYRSFNDASYGSPLRYSDVNKPQIYTAVYSGVSVYEMEVHGVACMRRRNDHWLNATQILKVAGVDKGKRTKVLEKEILTGEHEKVQGGYGKYQGTWISYQRGREFCRQYGVEDLLKPLLEYDMNGDGANGGPPQETPTKEQAMAAQRKKFYNSSMEARNGLQTATGTFFQNISPMSSVALAAMNKAARINSPVGRTGSGYRLSGLARQPSQALPDASQQSLASEASFGADQPMDSAYATQNGATGWRQDPLAEPPRKKMRPSQDFGTPGRPADVSMRSTTPTEPNESFVYTQQQYLDGALDNEEPTALPPLPAPSTREEEEKKMILLDLFADSGRTDFSTHPAITQLSAEDLNMPLDASANTVLHWAATLARVPLLKLLVCKGANIYRGNAAGQSALISAVLVNNSWELSCFPSILELLGPLIEVRDATGRTILHHIVVSSGIKGRAPSSKYYLEVLLEFLVRSASGRATTNGDSSGQDPSSSKPIQSSSGPMSLMKFLSTIVNAQDKAGNTALNLVARIGNRNIIQQLLEIKADPTIPNFRGVSARDFGIGVEDVEHVMNGVSYTAPPQLPLLGSPNKDVVALAESALSAGSQAEDHNQDVIASITSMLTSNLATHKQLLAAKTVSIDRLNAQIRELSAQQKQELDTLQNLTRKAKARTDRVQKIANLRRLLSEKKAAAAHNGHISPRKRKTAGDVDVNSGLGIPPNLDLEEGDPETQEYLATLPSPRTLRARLEAYRENNKALADQSAQLKSRSLELEGQYRKAVALCTQTAEEKVEECLPSLIAAVESERGGLGREEVGRIREFLMKVEGVGGEV